MTKTNLFLATAAFMALLLGWFLGSGERQSEFSVSPVFPDLQKQIDLVDGFTLSNANGTLLQAIKRDGAWLAQSRNDYPLQQNQVIGLLNNLVQTNLDSAKTAKPENYARLGLKDITEQDSNAKLLTIRAGQQEWSLLVGNTASSGSGVYVRKPGESQTWLTKTMLNLSVDMSSWLDTQILDIKIDSVSEIARKDHWQITRTAAEADANSIGAAWHLAELEEGRALQYDSILNSTAENILSLSFDALAQQRPLELNAENMQSQVSITTVSGEQIVMKLYKNNDEYLLLLDSDSLDSHWTQWVYQLSAFTAGRLTKTVEDFLQPLPEEPLQTDADNQ